MSSTGISIDGDLDVGSVPRVRDALDRALAVRPGVLVVDLGRCPLVDAAGIALLLTAHRRARADDGLLVLRSPTAQVRRIFEIARVAHIFDIEPG